MKHILFLLLLVLTFSACQEISHTVFPPKTIIGIQPYGSFSEALTDTIRRNLHAIYGFDVVVLPAIDFPETAFTALRFPRYRADSLLRHLKAIKPDSIAYLIGLTNKDISTTKRTKDGAIKKPESKYIDYGIFGLGYCPGPSCVVSSYRYKKKVSRKKFLSRFKKICMHEIGHNLGLPHCPHHEKCVMRDAAETIKTIDKVDMWLCDQCAAQIKSKLPKSE